MDASLKESLLALGKKLIDIEDWLKISYQKISVIGQNNFNISASFNEITQKHNMSSSNCKKFID